MSKAKFKNPVVKWIDHRLPIFSFMDHELNHYPTPKNLNYFLELWIFGRYCIGNNDYNWNCLINELYCSCRLCI